MTGDDASRWSRREVLRRGLGTTAVVGLAATATLVGRSPPSDRAADPVGNASMVTGAGSGDGDAAPLRVTVGFASGAPESHLDQHVRPALRSYAVQAGVDAAITSVTSLSQSVGLGDDYDDVLDRFARWSDDEVRRRDGHVNLLVYTQFPMFGSAYACDHRGTLESESAPIAVCNADVALFWPRTAYRNTITTAIARPVLAGMRGETLPNGERIESDVNAFGTVVDGEVPRSSPLATWHTPAADGCLKPNNVEGEDIVDSHCGHDSVVASCGYTTRLSECTRLATRARLAEI